MDEEDKPTWLKHLMTPSGAIVVVVGAGEFTLDELYGTTCSHKRIEKGILKATMPKNLTRGPHVERKELNEYLRRCLQVSRSHARTAVVYGPCGSGKSAAVRNILKEQQAIVHVVLNKGTKDKFVFIEVADLRSLVVCYNEDHRVQYHNRYNMV